MYPEIQTEIDEIDYMIELSVTLESFLDSEPIHADEEF